MAEIRLISRATVAPKNPSESTQRIELTPWELQYLLADPIQKGLLFRNLPQDHVIVDHLKTSLSRALDFFYPLAGRLGTIVDDDHDTTCFFINCNGDGVQFIHAAADGVTVGDILDRVKVPKIVSSFFPLNETRNYHGTSDPLLAVQVTELVDGLFVGCSMNHAVADGNSFWHFLNSWSEISRRGVSDENLLASPPIFKRWSVPETELPIRIPQIALVTGELPTSPIQERVFHFGNEKISALKEKAKVETETCHISSLQALLAHIWRSVIRNRRLPEDQETTYFSAIGMRARVDLPLPEQYFGAAVQGGAVTMKAGEILSLGLGHTALQMNKMISSFTPVSATNFFESWAKNPMPISASNLRIGNFLVLTSSPRFNVYGNDFGWGRPVAVRSGGGNKYDGKITAFEGGEEGSIDIEVCLSPETLEAMAEDAEFMDAVTL